MKLIAAVDERWGLGYRGELLAHVRADLKNFAALTTGKTVILGSKTLATFPGGRPLKNRENIVMSRRADYSVEGAIVVHSVEELLEAVKERETDDIFVIGGESIYAQLLEYCDTAYITKFKKTFEADAFLEDLDASEKWECISVGETQLSNGETDTIDRMEFCYCEYRRR